jgi:protein-disulfide isomerase
MNSQKNKLTIVLSILVAALAIGGAIIYISKGAGNQGGDQNQNLVDQGLSVEELSLKGDPKAKATILEFGDFQCIACAQFFAAIEPQITKELLDTGKANMAFKTLTFIDQYAGKERQGESWLSAQATECAADQGKFWEMYDAIYQAEVDELLANKQNENSGNLTRDFFVKTAQNLKMGENQFTSCLDSQKHTDKIDSFMADAQKAMGNRVSTPSVYVIKDSVVQKVDNPFDFKSLEAIITGTNQ